MTLIPPASSVPVPSPPNLRAPISYDWTPEQTDPQKQIDIKGVLHRRKYLVILLAVAGGFIGFIQYLSTAKTYESTIKLMVSTQAPPELIEGNVRVAKDSNQKYANLIFSDLVLGGAVEKGKFQEMQSFIDSESPVETLKNDMLDVSADKELEAITIQVEGPVPSELPTILARIVESFREVTEQDSQNVSEQTVAMIENLAAQLSSQKNGADEEKEEIRRRLGMILFDKSGRAINPFEQEFNELEVRKKSIIASLHSLRSRMLSIIEPLKADPSTGKPDLIQFKVIALEARDYLNVGNGRENGSTGQEQFAQEIRNKIYELQLQVFELSTRYGSGHSSIVNLNRQIAFHTNQLKAIQNEVTPLGDQISSISTEETASHIFLKQAEEWVAMYKVALGRELEKLNSDLKVVSEQLTEVSTRFDDTADDINRLNVLQQQIDSKEQAVELIMDRLSEINVLANNYTMTKVRVLDEPKLGVQIAPSLPKLVAQAVLLATMLGLGLAVLIDVSELAFRSPHEIVERLQLPVVGKVPRIDTSAIKPSRGSPCLVSVHNPASTAAEAIRDIRTGLFFQSSAHDLKTILFTSPSAGDGKSTTIGNLAVSIAQAGKRVVLIDADFRRPRVDQYFGVDLSPGILDVFAGKVELTDAIEESELQEGLFLLTTGGRPKNPGEVVTSEIFRNLIETLRNQFDFVLIDAPPVLPVADAATIASFADGVYMVTRICKGVKLSAQKAKESLDRVGATWIGIIVNSLDDNQHYSEYGYQYGSYSHYGGTYGKYYEANNKEYREKVGS